MNFYTHKSHYYERKSIPLNEDGSPSSVLNEDGNFRCCVEKCSTFLKGRRKYKKENIYHARGRCFKRWKKRLLRLHKYRSLLLDGDVKYDSE